jgi:hypothetical protein
MLTQDVAYLKSQLQSNSHHSPLHSPHVVVTNNSPITSPHNTNSPLASPHITNNPFATNSPLSPNSNPQYTNQFTPVKPVTNPFNTNY